MKEFNPTGLTNDTIKQINNFNDKLESLGNKIPLDVKEKYIENGERFDEIPSEIYDQLDELKTFETKAILNELQTMTLQAKRSGVKLPAIIEKLKETQKLGNIPLVVEFSQKALEKIPNLKVFSAFNWLTEKELEQAKSNLNKSDAPDISDDDDFLL